MSDPRGNPYTTALAAFGGIILIVGFVILGIGIAHNANYKNLGDDSGSGEIYLGIPIIVLGAIMFVGGAIVAAMKWTPSPATPARPATHLDEDGR